MLKTTEKNIQHNLTILTEVQKHYPTLYNSYCILSFKANG